MKSMNESSKYYNNDDKLS